MLVIKPLSASDAGLYIDHFVRSVSVSGVGDTPLFTVIPAGVPIDKEKRRAMAEKAWQITTGLHGWERAWGAYTPIEGVTKIVGSVTLSSERLAPCQMHRCILGIGIEPGYRHVGLGRNLMTTALTWCKSQTFLSWVDLGVFADNLRARRLYESFQFQETGRTIDCFRVNNIRVDDIHMTLELKEYAPKLGTPD